MGLSWSLVGALCITAARSFFCRAPAECRLRIAIACLSPIHPVGFLHSMSKQIGVLTSGGDCPGLNAVLRGVVRAATSRGWGVVGFHDGFEGMLPPARYEVMTTRRTAGTMHLGGTILGTTNRGHFVPRTAGCAK